MGLSGFRQTEDLRLLLGPGDDPSASVELALATVEFYGLEMNEAKTIPRQVATYVTQWREVAAGLGATRHDDLYAALRF